MLGVELTQKVVQVGVGLAYSFWRALAEKRFLCQGRIFESITIFQEMFFLLAALRAHALRALKPWQVLCGITDANVAVVSRMSTRFGSGYNMR